MSSNNTVRELGKWIIDFPRQTAYTYLGGEYDEFECRNFRIRDTNNTSRVRFRDLPNNVRKYLRSQWPNMGKGTANV